MGNQQVKWRLTVADMILSALWVVSGSLVKVISKQINGGQNEELLICVLRVLQMFFFTWIGRTAEGASYNPLNIITNFLLWRKIKGSDFCGLITRIAAQALGAVIGVRCVNQSILQLQRQKGPNLRVSLKHGMAVEGVLTFVIVMTRLVMNVRGPKDFLLATWISSLMKLSLGIIGADFTGAAMNPASAFGWAYARDKHATKEHVCVYWLAPINACLLATFIFEFMAVPLLKGAQKEDLRKKKNE